MYGATGSEILGVDMEFATFIPEGKGSFRIVLFIWLNLYFLENAKTPRQVHSNLPRNMA